MTSTERLQWWIDEWEYNHFREYVEDKHGVIGLCFPSEVVQAMRTYLDKDRAAAVEDKLAALDETLADSLGDYSRRRKSSEQDGPLVRDDFGSGEKKKVRCKVPKPLHEEFTKYIDEHTEWGYGEALGRAMNAYRDGSREQRLADTLDTMTAAVESVDVDTAGTDQADESEENETRPYNKDEKMEAIRRDLADANGMDTADEIEQLPRQQVVQFIHKYCSQNPGEDASDRTVSNYLDYIKDDLELTDHPKNDVLLVKDDEIDGLTFENKEYDALTTEERVEAVRVKLLRKADAGRGAQVSAADIQTEFFDGEPSDSVAHDLRNRAADADGFAVRTAPDGVKKVRVNTSEVSDDLLDAAGLLDQRAAEAEATAEMDALMNAQVVTDGGVDTRED